MEGEAPAFPHSASTSNSGNGVSRSRWSYRVGLSKMHWRTPVWQSSGRRRNWTDAAECTRGLEADAVIRQCPCPAAARACAGALDEEHRPAKVGGDGGGTRWWGDAVEPCCQGWLCPARSSRRQLRCGRRWAVGRGLRPLCQVQYQSLGQLHRVVLPAVMWVDLEHVGDEEAGQRSVKRRDVLAIVSGHDRLRERRREHPA